MLRRWRLRWLAACLARWCVAEFHSAINYYLYRGKRHAGSCVKRLSPVPASKRAAGLQQAGTDRRSTNSLRRGGRRFALHLYGDRSSRLRLERLSTWGGPVGNRNINGGWAGVFFFSFLFFFFFCFFFLCGLFFFFFCSVGFVVLSQPETVRRSSLDREIAGAACVGICVCVCRTC